jgi:hypothetical protein
MAAIIAESTERMSGRWLADFGHIDEERRRVLIYEVVGVRPEETRIAGSGGVGRTAESLS